MSETSDSNCGRGHPLSGTWETWAVPTSLCCVDWIGLSYLHRKSDSFPMRHWIHVSLLEMVSRALLPMGMGWLADSRSEVSVYPDGPEVAEEYPSVVDLVHRVRYLEQRLTSSEAEPGN